MIRPASKKEDLDYAVQKFKETNRFGINTADFFKHLQEGIKRNTSGVYISAEGEKVEGCLVVSIVHPAMVEKPIMWIDFVYSDNTEVARKLSQAAENIAKVHGVRKISGSMKRGSDAIIKRYGYKEDYIVISKEV